jgi:hypothetical protein
MGTARFECLVGQADRDVTGSGPLLEVINTVLLDLLDGTRSAREGSRLVSQLSPNLRILEHVVPFPIRPSEIPRSHPGERANGLFKKATGSPVPIHLPYQKIPPGTLVWWTAEQRMGREHGGLTGMALDVFTAPGEFPLGRMGNGTTCSRRDRERGNSPGAVNTSRAIPVKPPCSLLTGMALDVFTAPGEFPLSLSLLEHVVPFPIRPSDRRPPDQRTRPQVGQALKLIVLPLMEQHINSNTEFDRDGS